jgi:hypothetical protein
MAHLFRVGESDGLSDGTTMGLGMHAHLERLRRYREQVDKIQEDSVRKDAAMAAMASTITSLRAAVGVPWLWCVYACSLYVLCLPGVHMCVRPRLSRVHTYVC